MKGFYFGSSVSALLFLTAALFGPSLVFGQTPPLLAPIMGESRLVFNSNPDYINDHTVIRGPDGKWHLIGITHRKVLGGRLPVPDYEREFIHAVAPSLTGPWTRLDPILPADKAIGETHVWAPHVVFSEGLYYCFYAGGGGHWDAMLNLATSPDLMAWTRYPGNPLFRDFFDARDPMVLRVGDRWVMYYTKTLSKKEWNSTVAYRTSADLRHWSEPGFALILRYLKPTIPNSQYSESPFVVAVGGRYYLFICAPDLNYKATLVFVSDDPFHFEDKDEIATLVAHCAEVVRDGDQFYLTHAGWFFDGLYLAPLTWQSAQQFSRPMLYAESGVSDEYLVSAVGAIKVRWGLTNRKALEVGPGQALEYRFPAPAGVKRVSLVFEEKGNCRVTAGGRVVLEEKAKSETEPELHALELAGPSLNEDGGLSVRFESSGPLKAARPVLNYVKVYFR